jgi:hypothetical protein
MIICPFCQQPCKEAGLSPYSNIREYDCCCSSEKNKRNFLCMIYKADDKIHQFYIHMDIVHLSFTYPNRWSIYTIDDDGGINYIDNGFKEFNPAQAFAHLKRYNILKPFL